MICFSWFRSAFTTRMKADDGFASEIGRTLRAFDMDGTPPCDHPGVIAFLKACKLADLTSNQIRVFLLLRDNPDPRGYTAADVASWLQMSVPLARDCLRRLQHKGYACHSHLAQEGERGQKSAAWICDPGNPWIDDGMLFWEFADLI